jgi:hypothetical protein
MVSCTLAPTPHPLGCTHAQQCEAKEEKGERDRAEMPAPTLKAATKDRNENAADAIRNCSAWVV